MTGRTRIERGSVAAWTNHLRNTLGKNDEKANYAIILDINRAAYRADHSTSAWTLLEYRKNGNFGMLDQIPEASGIASFGALLPAHLQTGHGLARLAQRHVA